MPGWGCQGGGGLQERRPRPRLLRPADVQGAWGSPSHGWCKDVRAGEQGREEIRLWHGGCMGDAWPGLGGGSLPPPPPPDVGANCVPAVEGRLALAAKMTTLPAHCLQACWGRNGRGAGRCGMTTGSSWWVAIWAKPTPTP